jgi:hypothetical protein
MDDHAHHHHHSPADVTTPLAITAAPETMNHHDHGAHDHSSMDHGDIENHMLDHMMSMAVS